MSWLDRCLAFAEAHGGAGVLPVLDAFGVGVKLGDAPPFEALEAAARAGVAARAAAIVEAACTEVDRPQAEMFARRYGAVAALLDRLAARHVEARILRVGLDRRLGEILTDPRPRALRVRAAVDFYYSRGAMLHHASDEPRPDLRTLVSRAVWRPVRPGVDHGVIDGVGTKGPVHINVLRVARGAARLVCVDCREDGEGVSLGAVAVAHGAFAAVSGGYFLYSEPDIAAPFRRFDPVGLLVHGGAVIMPPVFARAALVLRDGGISAERIGLTGASLRLNTGETVKIGAVNDPQSIDVDSVAFTRAWGTTSPDHAGPSLAVGAGRVIGATARGPLPIPLAGAVVTLPVGSPLPQGDRATWTLADPTIREAMGGGPLLLRDGLPCIQMDAEDFCGTAPPLTFSHDETFDQNQLPRMAAGVTADGALVLAAVDGRNFDRALGLTLHEAAELMALLGCTTALNLDGGSSKRMVVDGAVVDIPSTDVVAGGTESPVRPVHTAILLA